jgi:hypothetical protein
MNEIIIRSAMKSEFLDLASAEECENLSIKLLGLYYDWNNDTPMPTVLINSMLHIQCRICVVSNEQAEFVMPFFGEVLQAGTNKFYTRRLFKGCPNLSAISVADWFRLCPSKTATLAFIKCWVVKKYDK